MSNQITNFPVAIYGKMEKFSETISRGRCRVFYKGRNRNGTYITDEFAEKLIASVPYTPVKGIYDVDDGDYTDHGQKRSEGRIYGVVPADPNFAWEWHEDSDGVKREYACFDVLYYTALYKEAGEIDGKSQSMELYRGTLKGDWKIVEGKKTYVFTDGCFLGLQALGDDVEPCFEGASFYSCEDNILALLEKYEKRVDLFQETEQGENETMPVVNFKISDNQKHDFLFNLLNPNFNEAGGWMIEYAICEVYDEYAIVRNYAEGTFERVYYTKDDEADTLEITKRERCFIVDINEEEKAALEAVKGDKTFAELQESTEENASAFSALNESIETLNSQVAELNNQISELNTQNSELHSQISELTESNENLTTTNSEYSTKVEEQETQISTLTMERDEANNNYAQATTQAAEAETRVSELKATVESLTEERDALAAYKKNVETEAKKAVVDAYVEHLSEEVIDYYMSNLDNYSMEELDMKLTYEQKKANPSMFSKAPVVPGAVYLPKEDDGKGGVANILARYEKH